MIEQVTIKNFKCLRDVTVHLDRFTMLVGANGSGKTSILQAIDLLCRSFHGRLQELDSEYRMYQSFGSSEPVELSCSMNGEDFHFQHPSTKVEKNKAKDAPESVRPRSLWLRLDANVLRSQQPAKNIRDMEPNGHGMHRALSSMLLERRDVFFKLENDLRRIVPSVKQLQPSAEHEIRFDTINGKGLKASQVSEGTLLTLGLLTAIHGVNRPGILLLDDIDRALHPRAQWELIGLLRGVLETHADIQIAATTHSPYLLDKMDPSEVRITSLRANGSTACEPLTSHPKFAKWKGEFHSGEMWSVFGEEWVATPAGSAP
jgi:predicted ATPase